MFASNGTFLSASGKLPQGKCCLLMVLISEKPKSSNPIHAISKHYFGLRPDNDWKTKKSIQQIPADKDNNSADYRQVLNLITCHNMN